MTKKLLLAAGSLLLLSGTVALQGCYDSGPDYYGGYGRGYYSGSGYYSEPYYAGGGYGHDYDEHPNYWANHEAREERQEAHQREERQEAAQRQENREERHEARETRHHGDHDSD